MTKWNCNVIKDLLPSYTDGICSEDTRRIVEEHLSECPDCKRTWEVMKEAEIVTDGIQDREMDYMKKVKRHFAGKNTIGFALFAGPVLGGILILVFLRMYIPLRVFYIALPVLTAAAWFMLPDGAVKKKADGGSRHGCGFCVAGMIFIGYTAAVEFFCLEWVIEMDINMAGPVMEWMLLAGIAAQAVLIIAAAGDSLKTGGSRILPVNIGIAGCCLSLAFISILYRMDSWESLVTVRAESFFVLMGEGILMAAVSWMGNRMRQRRI